MALDQSALLELLEALRVAEVDDRIRSATEVLYQALIEAELTLLRFFLDGSIVAGRPSSAAAQAGMSRGRARRCAGRRCRRTPRSASAGPRRRASSCRRGRRP